MRAVVERSDPYAALERFEPLFAAIYEAALQPDLWRSTLDLIVEAIAGSPWDVACLMWENMHTHKVRFVGSTHIAPDVKEAYAQGFAALNPFTDGLVRQTVGEVVDSRQLIDSNAFRGTKLYRELLGRWNLDRFVSALIDRMSDDRLLFIMPGPTSAFPVQILRDVRILVPHLQRAARIGRRLGELELAAASSAAALDLAPGALIALGPDLRILTCNGRAAQLLASGALRAHDQKLFLSDPNDRARLEAVASPKSSGSAAFRIEWARGALLAHAARLRPHAAPTLGTMLTGASILFLASEDQPCDAPLLEADAAAIWWGLTRSESEIAAAIAGGSSVEELARARGTKPNAVRWHLKHIFQKTNVHSQAELAALIAKAPKR